jgi:hypothetical protein
MVIMSVRSKQKEGIMAAQTKRATIYFAPDLHKALRLKAVETNQSLSELVNDAVRESLAEDAEDLAAFDDRAEEPAIPYDEMVMRLRKGKYEGTLLFFDS